MFKRFLFFIFTYFFLVSYVYAELEEKLSISENYVSQNHVLDNKQNYFLTSTNHQITPKVNPITGEYCEEVIDFTIFGVVLLSARRFYNFNAPYDSCYSYWRYNPEYYFVANFEWQEQEIFSNIGDVDSSIFFFKRSSNNHSSFDFKVPKNFLFSQCSGSSHPLNTIINNVIFFAFKS